MSTARILVSATALVLASMGAASEARAQAWASDHKELSLSSRSSFEFSSGVYFGSDPGLLTGLGTQSIREILTAEYVVIPKLTVSLGGEFSMSKYTGAQTGTGGGQFAHGDNDDGDFHGALTDITAEVRYQLTNGNFGFSPLVRVKTPMTDYEKRGYAASGKGNLEGSLGAYAGWVQPEGMRLFVQGYYTFTLVGKVEGEGFTQGGTTFTAAEVKEELGKHTPHRSDLGLQFGKVFGEKLISYLSVDYRLTHGGAEILDVLAMQTSNPILYHWHDPVMKEKLLSVGLGANYGLTDAWDLGVQASAIVWGDGVSDQKIIALTLSWKDIIGDDAAAEGYY